MAEIGEGDSATSNFGNVNLTNSLPEIEIKISEDKMLLNVYCEKQKGILKTLLEEVEKRHLSVVNCSMISFENLALDITIVAQMEQDFNQNVKDLVRELRSIVIAVS